MKKKKRTDLLALIFDFQRNLFKNKPSTEKMFEEVRMMKFKIRPLQGDVSDLNLRDKQFIEILWNLGKLDDFFHKESTNLTSDQKEVFFRFLDDLYERFQTQLNKVDLKMPTETFSTSTIEMEIFKEDILKKKLN